MFSSRRQQQQQNEHRRRQMELNLDRRIRTGKLWVFLFAMLLLLQIGAAVDAESPAPSTSGADETPSPTDSDPLEPDTPSPTEEPTPPPSIAPTPSPTDEPTKPPTISPTPSPTPAPTTPEPTPVPTPGPTTPEPTRSPTMAPTTPPPTTQPTPMPTPTGTPEPTGTNSNAPSPVPSAAPSARESVAPTSGESPAPTLSSMPTISPSASPSSMPSTNSPSSQPSISPSDVPSVSPTAMPSLSLQSSLVRVLIWFDNASELKGSAEINFQSSTAEHIKSSIRDATSGLLEDLTVGTNIVRQDDEPAGSSVRRRLQSLGPLGVYFDTRVAYRYEEDDLDVAALVGGAFDTDDDQETYLLLLKRTDNTFSTISEVVQVKINDEVLPDPQEPNGSSNNLLIIIGASCGGAALIILCGLVYVRQRSKDRRAHFYSNATKQSTEPEAGVTRIQTDIYVEPQDEISTLGDPMYAPGAMHMGGGLDRDETVTASIVSGDYDYAKAYGTPGVLPSQHSSNSNKSEDPILMLGDESADLPSSTDLGSNLDNSLFSDDSSFEQQFNDLEERIEVMAPAGKLGMVIDTPSGGVPVVHAIKDTSVLADRVQVGDRLVLVDDEDTTRMTAMQVSKLISVKAEKPARVLVFVRTRARTNSLDD